MDLTSTYSARHSKFLVPLAENLCAHLRDLFSGFERIDRISARAKSIDRFLEKAVKTDAHGNLKYANPIDEIQDQVGARIVTFYVSDVKRVADEVTKYLRPIENQKIVPDSESEFGYVGQHFVMHMPEDLFDNDIPESECPNFFELQIKTLFQHAWSEANHDLVYKPDTPLTPDQKRCIAYSAAQAWGADRMFDTLHQS